MHIHRIDRRGPRTVALALAAAIAAALAATAMPPPVAAQERAGERLGAMVQDALREGGPFFTPEERAVIERKCGYAPGSWDGFEINVSNGVLQCRDGRRVDDPEVRAIMASARPRIEARVEAVMERAEIAEAIGAVAREATDKAMRALADRRAGSR